MNEGTTHHGTCWQVHPECAQARMREIEQYVANHADKMRGDPVGWRRQFWQVFRGERKG